MTDAELEYDEMILRQQGFLASSICETLIAEVRRLRAEVETQREQWQERYGSKVADLNDANAELRACLEIAMGVWATECSMTVVPDDLDKLDTSTCPGSTDNWQRCRAALEATRGA